MSVFALGHQETIVAAHGDRLSTARRRDGVPAELAGCLRVRVRIPKYSSAKLRMTALGHQPQLYREQSVRRECEAKESFDRVTAETFGIYGCC
jgi:hypothetical protein